MASSLQRLAYIDIARGIGIILVVLSHSANPDLMYWANGFFMPLFYVITGYTDKTDHISREVIIRKAKRLLVPYFVFSLLLLVIYNHHAFLDYIGVLYSRYGVFRRVGENILFLESGNRPLWFLTSLFSSYVCYFILISVSSNNRMKLILVYLLVSLVLKYSPFLLPWSLDIATVGALYIYAGREMRDYRVIQEKFPIKFILCITVLYALCHIINGIENMSMGIYGRIYMLSIVCGCLGSLLVFYFSKYVERFSTVLGGG